MHISIRAFKLKQFLLIPLAISLGVAAGCRVEQTSPGQAPEVNVEPGQAPEYEVEGPEVNVETQETPVTVPEVDINQREETIEVPQIEIETPSADPEQ